MEFKEAVKIALQSLWANKLRSVLTLLGVVIGVTSVIAVVTLVNGANAGLPDSKALMTPFRRGMSIIILP